MSLPEKFAIFAAVAALLGSVASTTSWTGGQASVLVLLCLVVGAIVERATEKPSDPPEAE